MVWHDAPWTYLPAMVESVILRVSNVQAAGESPMLWFSANQQLEATDTKMLRNISDDVVQLPLGQQGARFGCIRFGLPADDVRPLSWKYASNVVGTPKETLRSPERVGKRMGANPAHWQATIRGVPLIELHFQVWTDGWCDATIPKDMAAVWVNNQAA